jgi:hypothetical protein
MTAAEAKREERNQMAGKVAGKDLLTRLADAGEEAIARVVEAPGADRVVGYVNNMRERVDELQKKVRGIDELERRVTELEGRLDELSGTPRGRTPAKRSTAAKGTSSAKSSAKKKPSTSASSASRATSSSAKTGGTSPG